MGIIGNDEEDADDVVDDDDFDHLSAMVFSFEAM